VTFKTMFDDEPVGRTTRRRWSEADPAVLNTATYTLEAHGANPWVFSADARHFWQFATAADVAAMQALNGMQFRALLGDWSEEDHDPASFGYTWPR
jgi:hypothetical protein